MQPKITKDIAQSLSELFEKIADHLAEAEIHADHRDFARDWSYLKEFIEANREYERATRMANTLYDIALKMLNIERKSGTEQ